MSISFPKIFSFFMLFLSCVLFWLLQSLPTLKQFFVENGGEFVTRKSVLMDESRLPSIVICNRLPYSQAALSAFGKAMKQDVLRAYLREWFDPSVVDSPDFEDMSEEDRKFAETTVAQVLPNAGLKQRLEQVFLKCQDFLSSCVIQGVSMSGFNCCENIQPFLATLGGICWIFANRTFVQESTDNRFGIQLTFQIAKNSYISSSQTIHPGLTVFLTAADESRITLASELLSSPAFNLKDKRHTTLFVKKQVELNRRRRDCEKLSWRDATNLGMPSYNYSALSSSTSLPACLVEAAVQECACVPLIVVLWTLQGDLDSSFLRRFDVSSICSADEYARCARKYVIQSNSRIVGLRSLTAHKQLRESVERCRSSSKIPCQKTSFETVQFDEADLPQEYRSTQDFVSKFSVAYDSLETLEVISEKAIDGRQLFTTLGYNLATWFAIGHLIWSLFGWLFTIANRRPSHKVEPHRSMMISSPIQIRPRPRQTLPPLEINGNDVHQHDNAKSIRDTKPLT